MTVASTRRDLPCSRSVGSVAWTSVNSNQSVRFLDWPEPAALGVTVGITTRHGGVSGGAHESLNLGLHVGDDPLCVIENRKRAAHAFGVDLESVVFAEQVHGAGATVVGQAERGRGTLGMDDAIPSTDILVTSALHTTLAILVADCVPLALLDPEAHVLAVVHAGWRGTAAQASRRALEAMYLLGAQPKRVVAFIGPGVHPARYQVDDDVHQALACAVAPHALAEEVALPGGGGRWHVDLMAANHQQLVLAGVAPTRIFNCGVTTADDDYFSDRATRPCGRFALLARLTEPASS
jgi:YfiH family protein